MGDHVKVGRINRRRQAGQPTDRRALGHQRPGEPHDGQHQPGPGQALQDLDGQQRRVRAGSETGVHRGQQQRIEGGLLRRGAVAAEEGNRKAPPGQEILGDGAVLKGQRLAVIRPKDPHCRHAQRQSQ